jgi:hypothetical protein
MPPFLVQRIFILVLLFPSNPRHPKYFKNGKADRWRQKKNTVDKLTESVPTADGMQVFHRFKDKMHFRNFEVYTRIHGTYTLTNLQNVEKARRPTGTHLLSKRT